MLDFHSHFSDSDSILNTGLLLPDKYSKENEDLVFSNSTWHVGEIGLDKRFSEMMPMAEQITVFSKLLERAKKHNIAVSIHSVQCTQMTVNLIKKAEFQPFKLLWHGFSGSKETACELAGLGVIISLGPKFRGNLSEIAKANPYFVLESDYTGNDEDEHRTIIADWYKKVSEELGMTVSELEEHCESIEKIFKN